MIRTRVLLALTPLLLALFAPGAASAAEPGGPAIDPSDKYELKPWIPIEIFGIDVSINKAVVYLFIALVLTVGIMVWIAHRMKTRPIGRIQTTVEMAYDLTRNNITGGNMDPKMAAKWFPFIGTLFFFIWFSNFIGYIPLPFLDTYKFNLFGLEIPSFGIYSATANLSMPLVLALVVAAAYHIEGVRAKGVVGYVRSWVPAGVEGFMVGPILAIEFLSHIVRVISLSLRLFANILAGHLLIFFMAGGLVILLGMGWAGTLVIGSATGVLGVAFFIFEIGLVVTLQAFIFASLTAIYLGGAVADEH